MEADGNDNNNVLKRLCKKNWTPRSFGRSVDATKDDMLYFLDAVTTVAAAAAGGGRKGCG